MFSLATSWVVIGLWRILVLTCNKSFIDIGLFLRFIDRDEKKSLFLMFEVFDLCDRLKSYNISLEHLLILRDACLLKNVLRDT